MDYRKFSPKAFTLIELMIAVAIVAVLAAVAIPLYSDYIRRSWLSEANSSIGSIKTALESYELTHRCYTAAPARPVAIPEGGEKVAWGDPANTTWARNALGVRPDANVRFQYEVYANEIFNSVGDPCAAYSDGAVDAAAELTDCVVGAGNDLISDTGTPYVNTSITGPDWYIVVARADLDGSGSSDNTNTTIMFSAIDDSTIGVCNELQ